MHPHDRLTMMIVMPSFAERQDPYPPVRKGGGHFGMNGLYRSAIKACCPARTHQLLRDKSPVLNVWEPHTCEALLTNHVMWYTQTIRSAPPHTSAGNPPRAKSAANCPTTCHCHVD